MRGARTESQHLPSSAVIADEVDTPLQRNAMIRLKRNARHPGNDKSLSCSFCYSGFNFEPHSENAKFS